jgi:NADPH:quinone reductase-like Zn-dependent oxidoreductase
LIFLLPRHAINLVSGRNQDSAYALYTVIPANKAAILPDNIPFTDGVVVPFALEAAICALCVKEPGVALPGISAPAWALPYPSVEDHVTALGKTLVVTGGSASAGSMTTQIATAAGMHVVAITGHKNFDLSKRCGATDVFDHKDPSVVDKVVEAIRNSGNEFVGIFDAISIPDTYTIDLAILAELGGGQLACTHPPPPEVPQNVKAGMILAVNDIATPVWRDYVTPALKAGKLQCLPAPTIVGKGLEHIQDALKKSKTGVSATKLVVEL